MRRAYCKVSGVMVVMVMLAVSACGEAAVDRGTPETTRAVSEATRVAIEAKVVDPGEPEVVFRVPVSYLEEVIPPCVPLEGSSHDPCATTTPQQVAILSAPSTPPSWPHTDDLPTITETVMGYGPTTITHIVVRATVLDGTTRCGLYPLTPADHAEFSASPSKYRYNCYADVRVNEYLVGTGPSELTVELHREVLNLTAEDLADWDNWKDGWLTDRVHDPEGRTAAAFEGKEVVLFLGTSFTIAVESWLGGAGIADVWFVQQPDEGATRAVAAEISLALTDEQRNNLDMPLGDLVTKIRAAATARDDEYDGRIGENTDLPDLVDDANGLRDFYIESGAVYQGDDKTTELPPPVGGPPEAPTNVAVTQDGDRQLITWDAAETGGEVSQYYVWIKSTRSDGTVKSFYNSKTFGAEREFEITYMVGSFGNEFTVQVRAWNSGGYSDWTDLKTLTTPPSVTTTTSTSASSSTTSISA